MDKLPEKNIFIRFFLFIISIPIVYIYLPLRYIFRLISRFLRFILLGLKVKEDNVFVKFFTWIVSPHPYKGNIYIFRYVEENVTGGHGEKNILYKIGVFFLSIPLIFVYIPLRAILKFLCKFILFLIRIVRNIIWFHVRLGKSYREIKENLGPNKKTGFFIVMGEIFKNRIPSTINKKIKMDNYEFVYKNKFERFLNYFVVPHPYKGNDRFIMVLETNVTGQKNQAQRNRTFIFFLVPALGSFLLFVFTPFFMGIYYSFTDWTGLNSGEEIYVGIANYKNIFSDYIFIYSFTRTTIYSVLNVIVINVVAFSLALLVTQKLKMKNIYRAGFFMPNLIGGLVLGYIWQFIYSSVFTAIGNNLGAETGIFAHSLIGGFANSSESMGALIAVVTWQYAGYIMMIYIAALQNVPQDLIEASKIDGASGMQRLRTIIFPLVAQAFTISLFLTLVTSFKQYDTVQALTQGGPSTLIPEYLGNLMNVPFWSSVNSLDLMAINIYETAFSHYEMGVGQAKAIVFFIILLVVSVIQVSYNQRKEVEL